MVLKAPSINNFRHNEQHPTTMLQLKTASAEALCNMRIRKDFPPEWKTVDELEKATDTIVELFLNERFEVSKSLGPGFLIPELIDRSIRTDDQEIMDNPAVASGEKLAMIRSLDRLNSMMMIYPHHIDLIEPFVRTVAAKKKRPATILELAGGAGGLALALAEEIKKGNLHAEIKGSDIIAEYVDAANEAAEKNNLPATFSLIDALTSDHAGDTEVDIILISQSLHHFTPGQIAVMIEKSRSWGASFFLALDGHRSPELLCGVPLMAMLQGKKNFMLDGYTSARKFYSEAELQIIAETATRKGDYSITFSWPLTVLSVAFG